MSSSTHQNCRKNQREFPLRVGEKVFSPLKIYPIYRYVGSFIFSTVYKWRKKGSSRVKDIYSFDVDRFCSSFWPNSTWWIQTNSAFCLYPTHQKEREFSAHLFLDLPRHPNTKTDRKEHKKFWNNFQLKFMQKFS